MNEKMRKALGFLGLVEDDYNEYTAADSPRPFTEEVREDPSWAPRRQGPVARPSAPTPRINPTPAPRSGAPAPLRPQGTGSNYGSRPAPSFENSQMAPRPRPVPATSGVRAVMTYAGEDDVEIMTPREFNECQRITDQLLQHRTVILVVTQCGPAVARRLIDFAAGTSYALRATVETMEKGAVYAICPHGASLSPETRARLESSNYSSVGY